MGNTSGYSHYFGDNGWDDLRFRSALGDRLKLVNICPLGSLKLAKRDIAFERVYECKKSPDVHLGGK